MLFHGLLSHLTSQEPRSHFKLLSLYFFQLFFFLLICRSLRVGSSHFIMHVAHHGCLKMEAQPLANILCSASTSQTADSFYLLSCVKGFPVWLQEPCKIRRLLVHRVSLSKSLGRLWPPQRECAQQVEKWWACLVLCPDTKFTPSTLDTRSRQQTLARPWGISGKKIFHFIQLSRLPLTQGLGNIQPTDSRILWLIHEWAWGGW